MLTLNAVQGPSQRRVLYVGYHGWLAKKILGFRWSKEAEITSETISFWQDILVNIFKFSLFLLINLIRFSKFIKALIKKGKIHSMRKEKLRKVGLCFVPGCFIKPFNLISQA